MAKILVLEDDAKMMHFYEQALQVREHETVSMENGQQLLDTVSQIAPDLIILDVFLIDSISGCDVCKELRKRPECSHIPILMISGKIEENEIKEGLRSGADGYLLKPLRLNEFWAKIELLLEDYKIFNATNITTDTEFAGRYIIEKQLGRGGGSEVYLAKDIKNNDLEVALKVLKPKEDSEQFISRFLREAYGLSRLKHPNIVKLLDFGNFQNSYYIVTEFVKGKSLKKIVENSPVDELSAVELAIEIGKAFTYMNEFGIVHRDIKPDNILISNEGGVTLVDFGLAREKHQQTISLKNEMYGTPQFISPEYINGSENLDIKTDIYSLGITLFFTVSGILPFQGNNAMALMQKQLNESPPPLSQVTDGLSTQFESLIELMLIKEPANRCSLTELIETLEVLKNMHHNNEI